MDAWELSMHDWRLSIVLPFFPSCAPAPEHCAARAKTKGAEFYKTMTIGLAPLANFAGNGTNAIR